MENTNNKLTNIEWVVMMRHEGRNSEVDGKAHTLANATLLANGLNKLPKPASTFFYPKRIKADCKDS